MKTVSIAKGFPRQNVAGLLNALEKEFVPIVRNALEDSQFTSWKEAEYRVDFKEDMLQVNGVMCYLTIKLADNTFIDDLKIVIARLEEFTTFEREPYRYLDYGWSLGDGDDGQAVFFEQGKLCIWLRGWK
jgi:hypothetical protein